LVKYNIDDSARSRFYGLISKFKQYSNIISHINKIMTLKFNHKFLFISTNDPLFYAEIPRLRQYYVYDPNLKKEVLIREKDVRKVSWTELFYDLIYVVLVDHLGKKCSGDRVKRYSLLIITLLY
jgi:hypothetical protein